MTSHHTTYTLKQRKEYIDDLRADPAEDLVDAQTRKEMFRSIVHDLCPEHEHHERAAQTREPLYSHELNFDD